MSMQMEVVLVAVMEGAERSVATRATEPFVPMVDRWLVAQVVGDVRRQGLPSMVRVGLLADLSWLVLDSPPEGQNTDHLGYDKHVTGASTDGNARNVTRSKTVATKAGPGRDRRSAGAVPTASNRRSFRSGNARLD